MRDKLSGIENTIFPTKVSVSVWPGVETSYSCNIENGAITRTETLLFASGAQNIQIRRKRGLREYKLVSSEGHINESGNPRDKGRPVITYHYRLTEE